MPRNLHSLDDLLHVGFEPANEIVLSSAIGPFSAGTTVQDFLSTLDNIIEALYAQGFTMDAVRKKTWSGVDAFTWTRRLTTTDGAQLQAVATSGGIWVAVGEDDNEGGAAVYSTHAPEGEWTRMSGWPFIVLEAVATDGTTWAVAGDGITDRSAPPGDPARTSGGRVFTTSRPLVPHYWTERLTNATGGSTVAGFSGITYANSRWVVWGNFGNSPMLYTATDAAGTWTVGGSGPFDTPGIIDITYGNGTWVGLSGGSNSVARQILTASDPAGPWTSLGNVGPAGVSFIRYANGYWLAGGIRISSGFHGGPWWATSPGGPWTEMTTAIGVGFALAHDGTRWLYVGEQGVSPFAARAITAIDPTGAWTQVTAPGSNGFTDAGTALATDGRVFAIVGADNSFSDSIIETALGYAYTAFSLDAYIARKLLLNATIKRNQTGSFTANAVAKKTQTSSFTVDARVASPQFTIDSVIKRNQTGSFTANAFVPGRFTLNAFIAGHFTLDAKIVTTGSSDFQSDTFQSDTFN